MVCPKSYKPVAGVAAEQCLLAIPTISQLALTTRRLSAGKATGEDGIPADVLRAAPAEVAAAMHPLAAQIALYAAGRARSTKAKGPPA
eukprot:10324805-Alexandrium_andersonii.AAC.1